jgi:hypothetical protein
MTIFFGMFGPLKLRAKVGKSGVGFVMNGRGGGMCKKNSANIVLLEQMLALQK